MTNIKKPVIGLFGTCGNSTWREPFIEKYKDLDIEFFNPQVAPGTWKPEDADIEAEHLAEDEIILFPITSETYAIGSLSEVGFSILQAINLDDRRNFVILINNFLNEELNEDQKSAKQSLTSRALVKQHLKKLRLSNLYLVDTIEEMLDVSIQLYQNAIVQNGLKKFNPHIKLEK